MTNFQLETATIQLLPQWVEMRAELWPHRPEGFHEAEIRSFLSPKNDNFTAFIAFDESGEAAGFAEASLRHEYVNGCSSSPVAFLEGIFVLPNHCRKGLARLLCDRIVDWGKSAGCLEFASDVLLENEQSQRFHEAMGFEETQRAVFYRREL